MGEGEGREEESCLVHIGIIRPPSSSELGAFYFQPARVRSTSDVKPFNLRRSERRKEARVVCGRKSRDLKGGEEAVGEGEEAGARKQSAKQTIDSHNLGALWSHQHHSNDIRRLARLYLEPAITRRSRPVIPHWF